MKIQLVALLGSLALATVAAAQTTGTLVISDCRIHPLSGNGQAQVPAEEAGKLTAINVREGMQVPGHDPLIAELYPVVPGTEGLVFRLDRPPRPSGADA